MRRTPVALVALALLVPVAAGPATAGGVVQAADDAPVPQQGGVNCEFPVSVTDATGQTVTVEEKPDRVVALQASAAQTMWEVGARGTVVGMPVRPYTAYLNRSTDRTDILAEDGSVVQEQVVALEPDLVLAPNALLAPNETVESLRQSGLTVYHFRQANSLEYVYEKTRTTGLLVGEYDNASRRAAEMEATVEAVRGAVAEEENPRVLYLLGPSGFAAGSNTFIGELVAAAGGNNVAGELEGGYSVVSGETVVAEDPEWIVVPEGRELPKTDAINGTTAVREGQVLRVNHGLGGLQVVFGMELHPVHLLVAERLHACLVGGQEVGVGWHLHHVVGVGGEDGKGIREAVPDRIVRLLLNLDVAQFIVAPAYGPSQNLGEKLVPPADAEEGQAVGDGPFHPLAQFPYPGPMTVVDGRLRATDDGPVERLKSLSVCLGGNGGADGRGHLPLVGIVDGQGGVDLSLKVALGMRGAERSVNEGKVHLKGHVRSTDSHVRSPPRTKCVPALIGDEAGP